MPVNTRQKQASMKWDNSRKGSTVIPPGRKPLPEPMTMWNSLLMVVLHVCRKVLLMDPIYKVPVYFAFLMFGSVLCDIGFPIPRSYFSNKDNALNQYFVKLGWGWTLLVTSAYIYLSSSVYCAGNRRRIVYHMMRMLVATAIWFFCTNFFVYVESTTGVCTAGKIVSRTVCIKKGHQWVGFDISGHVFILMFCNLLMSEEGRSLQNWERIGDIVRNEQFDDDSPIKDLSDQQKLSLASNYSKYTPYIRLLFIAITALAVLWDVMLVATVLYFHNMVQKVAGGIFAVVAWFFVYKAWYPSGIPPPSPGVGLVKYCDVYRR